MQTISIRELQEQVSEILRRVRDDGEAFAVIDEGQVVAQLLPVGQPQRTPLSYEEWRARADRLIEEISALWPAGVSAVDAVCEQRREL